MFKGVETLGENLSNFWMKEGLDTDLGLNIGFTDFNSNEEYAFILDLNHLLVADNFEILLILNTRIL